MLSPRNSGRSSASFRSQSNMSCPSNSDQLGINSPRTTYRMRLSPGGPPENGSISSSQSMPSMYVRKMRMGGVALLPVAVDSFSKTQPQQLSPHKQAGSRLSGQVRTTATMSQWYKMTKKPHSNKVTLKEIDEKNPDKLPPISRHQSDDTIHRNAAVTRTANQENEIRSNSASSEVINATAIAPSIEVSDSSRDSQLSEVKSQTKQVVTDTSRKEATTVAVPVIITPPNDIKTNIVTENSSENKTAQIVKVAETVESKTAAENTKVPETENSLEPEALPAALPAQKSGEKERKQDPSTEPKNVNKPSNDHGDEQKEDDLNKLIRDLDSAVDANLSQLSEDNPGELEKQDPLLQKVLSKEFQDKVDDFLKSDNYQTDFYDKCKDLIK